MMRTIYNLLEEPTAEVYRGLLETSIDYCGSFLLIVRHTIGMGDSATAVLESLKPALISQAESSEWPGTQLLDDTATVFRFELSHQTVTLLRDVTHRLFSWTQPELPEDLCLLRFDENPWLVTIAHEGDGYLILSEEERSALESKIPSLAIIRQEAP